MPYHYPYIIFRKKRQREAFLRQWCFKCKHAPQARLRQNGVDATTKCRCSHYRDIMAQARDPKTLVNRKSFVIAIKNDCPYFVPCLNTHHNWPTLFKEKEMQG